MNNLQQTGVYSVSLRYLNGQTNIQYICFVALSPWDSLWIWRFSRKKRNDSSFPKTYRFGVSTIITHWGGGAQNIYTHLFFSPDPKQINFDTSQLDTTDTAAINK